MTTESKAVNWGAVSLPQLYANFRCLKDELYCNWIENLRRFVLDPAKAKASEAARRLEFIETELRGRSAAAVHELSSEQPANIETNRPVRIPSKIRLVRQHKLLS